MLQRELKDITNDWYESEYQFTMTVSAYDCTGCGSCVNVCPGKKGEKGTWLWKTWKQNGRAEILSITVQ